MILEPLDGFGESPSVGFCESHRAVRVEPIFGHVGNQLERILDIFWLNAKVLQQGKLGMKRRIQQSSIGMHLSVKEVGIEGLHFSNFFPSSFRSQK